MLSRRSLLKANFKPYRQAIRLPWVRDELEFVDSCSRCGDCITACPEKIIVKGDGGFPELNFTRGECIFCTDCVQSCNEDLFTPLDDNPWSLKAVVVEECLSYKNVVCVICKEQCETEAISFIPRAGSVSPPVLALEECTGCGACVKPCPGQAIKLSYQFNENEQSQDVEFRDVQIKENAS
jgi:ferredoxin-type protein NapF